MVIQGYEGDWQPLFSVSLSEGECNKDEEEGCKATHLAISQGNQSGWWLLFWLANRSTSLYRTGSKCAAPPGIHLLTCLRTTSWHDFDAALIWIWNVEGSTLPVDVVLNSQKHQLKFEEVDVSVFPKGHTIHMALSRQLPHHPIKYASVNTAM